MSRTWVGGLLIYAISGSTAPLYFGTQAHDTRDAHTLDTIVAVVNDDLISRCELDTAIARIRTQLTQRKVHIPTQTVLEQQVLERLILGKLQQRMADQQGLRVDDDTLNAAILRVAQHDGLSLSQLHDRIEQKEGLSFADFRDEIRRELLSLRLRQKLVDSQVHLSDAELDSREAQLQSALKETGGATRQYHLAQILIALPENAAPAEIETAKRKAIGVLAQLRQGADFSQLAVNLSADRQALEGGDLGWRPADQLPTLFSKVVPRLKAGQVSEPLRSPSGFHLVKVVDVREAAVSVDRPTAVPPRAKLREAMMRQTADEEWEQMLRRFRDEAYVEIRLPSASTAP